MVRQKFGSHYSVHETGFQFDVDLRREPSITVDYERVSREQWTLTREGTFRQVFTLIPTGIHIYSRTSMPPLVVHALVDGAIVVVIPSLVPSVLPRYQSQQMVFRHPTKPQIFHRIIPKTTCLASIAFPQIPHSLAHSMHVNASSCCATQEISTVYTYIV